MRLYYIVVLACLFAGIGPAIAARQCTPHSDAPPVDEPYNGYAPTGHKGSLEPDSDWFKLVKTVRMADGTTRYAARNQRRGPRQVYESIEPITLGGHYVGLVARRHGCAELLRADGSRYDVVPFDDVETVMGGYGMSYPRYVLLKLTFTDEQGRDFSYVKFGNGRKVAQSTGHYTETSSWSGLLLVRSADTDRVGVLRVDDLKDVLKPEWKQIDLFYNRYRDPRLQGPDPRFLVAVNDGYHLFTVAGEAIPLARFDNIEHVYDFFFAVRRWPSLPIVVTTDSLSKTCRLYSTSLRPLLEESIPIDRYGECVAPDWKELSHLAFTDADGRTQIYRKELLGNEPKLTKTASNIDGTVIDVLPGGMVILKSGSGSSKRFRLVGPDGNDVSDGAYDDVRIVGCGRVNVKKDGEWWSVESGGKLVSPLYPSSC